MPELPEVETVRRYLGERLVGQQITDVTLRRPDLRYPIPAERIHALSGLRIAGVRRRAKYLLIDLQPGSPTQPDGGHACADAGAAVLMIHLGMSGRAFITDEATDYRRHEHWRMRLRGPDGRTCLLRYQDARRFGALDTWRRSDEANHRLLRALGPEPLSAAFNADFAYQRTRGRQVAIKAWLMDSKNVVGVGNIYACEALHRAGVSPRRRAANVGRAAIARLVGATRQVLQDAIADGGTSLRDFVSGDESPGYFKQRLDVYGREGAPCTQRWRPCAPEPPAIRRVVQHNRSTFYCPGCQR
jgi:formamidopyrimidine-DNA glycosylase